MSHPALRALEQMCTLELPALAGSRWAEVSQRLQELRERQGSAPEDTDAVIVLEIETVLRDLVPEALGRFRWRLQQEATAGNESRDDPSWPAPSRAGPAVRTRGMPSPDVFIRYTDVSCPRRVWILTPRVSLTVRLTERRPLASAAVEAMALEAGRDVRVHLQSPAFDLVECTADQSISLPLAGDSLHAVFHLNPRRIGATWIKLDFFQGGHPLGTVRVPVEVTAHEVSHGVELLPDAPLRLVSRAEAPELLLYIRYQPAGDQVALVFELRRGDGEEGIDVGRTFEPVTMRQDPGVYAQALVETLTALNRGLDPAALQTRRFRKIDSEELSRRLKQIGQNLWKDLLPPDLKALYTTERERWAGKTLLVVSDEPAIPWELVWPYGSDWTDDEPWCATLRLTRWLRGDSQGNGSSGCPAAIRLGRLACIAPRSSGLPNAIEERRLILELMKERGVDAVSPARATWSAVMDILEGRGGEGYDWFHAACHGTFAFPSAEMDSAIWLDDDEPSDKASASLTPHMIVGDAEACVARRRPAFVLNACQVGEQAWTLTRIGGWASRLISAGASLFAAPLWSVADGAALAFNRGFYGALLAGRTVADATWAGRRAARKAGGPTWLAYSVYAHPNARVMVSPELDVSSLVP